MPSKKKGLLSSLIEQGRFGASLIVNKLELGAGLEKAGDFLVPVVQTGHLGAGPIAINVERSISFGRVAGPVGVAAHEVYLISEEDLSDVFGLIRWVLDEEGEAEERVVSRGLGRSVWAVGGVILVGGETQLQGEDQKEGDKQDLHHIFKYYPPD